MEASSVSVWVIVGIWGSCRLVSSPDPCYSVMISEETVAWLKMIVVIALIRWLG